MGHAVSEYAWGTAVRSSSVKLVFLALAENADNETGEAFPSIASIIQRTQLDRKTVMLALRWLQTNGFIEDTRRRVGGTQRVKVYRFIGAPFEVTKTGPKTAPLNGPKIPHETVPKFPGNSPKNGTRNQSGTCQGINHTQSARVAPRSDEEKNHDAISQFDEAKRIICSEILNGKDPARPWSYEADAALSRILPLPWREIKLIAWFHGLTADESVHALKVRRQSESSLLANWSDEVTRAAAYRKRVGAGRPPTKKEPTRWGEFFQWKYGNEIRLPAKFADLDRDQQREFETEHEDWETAHPWESVAIEPA